MTKKQDVEPTNRTKKKKRYADMLRARGRFPKHGLRGGQEVPMDIDKINASFEATQKKE